MENSDAVPHIILVGGHGGYSGVPRHIGQLSTALAPSYQITVISDVNHGGYDQAIAEGARHVALRGLGARYNLFLIIAAWISLIRCLNRHPAQVIWLHARLPTLFARLALACRLWRPKAKVMVTLHGLPFAHGRPAGSQRLSLMIERALLSCCPMHHIVLLTSEMMRSFVDQIGPRHCARHNLHVLSNCSNLDIMPKRKLGNGRHLVMSGRVAWQKDIPLAVRLLAALPPDFTLTLAGDGTADRVFQRKMRQLVPEHVIDRMNFAGPCQDISALLATADAYLLTSRYEGVPIGALEAFEAGLPIILRNFDGAKALTDMHPCAVLDDFNDLPALAAKITLTLAQYQSDRGRFEAKIRKVWAQEWSFEPFRDASAALIRKVAA